MEPSFFPNREKTWFFFYRNAVEMEYVAQVAVLLCIKFLYT